MYPEFIGVDPVGSARTVMARLARPVSPSGPESSPAVSNPTPSTPQANGVTMVGDSITDMSKDKLKSKIPGIKIYSQVGKHMAMNAGASNGGDSGLKILRDNKSSLKDIVVIALGTNDEDATKAVFEGHINEALSIIGNKPVVFVNVTNNNAINSAISSSASRHTNIRVADWKSVAKLGSDGIHPTAEGQTAFADAVSSAISSAGGVVGAVAESASSGTVSGVGGIDAAGMQTIGTAAAFAVTLEGPTNEERIESLQLTGNKSYMNDKPLIEFIEQLCSACMHQFQSLPDGRFYAFFPDYFGSWNHRDPYWSIDDIEITDATIYLSDENLFTHVYVVGDTMESGMSGGGLGPAFINRLNSNGVVTIFDAFNMNWIDGSNSKVFSSPETFMAKYGVRPHYEDAPYVHSPFFEMFVAFQKFMFLWSRQFLSQCEFTFMPEMYPGGRVEFKDRGFVCYVDSVVHEFDYENGFTTRANLSAPASSNNTKGYADGMIRSASGGSL